MTWKRAQTLRISRPRIQPGRRSLWVVISLGLRQTSHLAKTVCRSGTSKVSKVWRARLPAAALTLFWTERAKPGYFSPSPPETLHWCHTTYVVSKSTMPRNTYMSSKLIPIVLIGLSTSVSNPSCYVRLARRAAAAQGGDSDTVDSDGSPAHDASRHVIVLPSRRMC